MVTMDNTLNWLTFRDYGSIVKVTWGYYVSKLTLFMWYFLEFRGDEEAGVGSYAEDAVT